jgi:hypothetical protein
MDNLHSSGWSHLTDTEIAQWQAEDKVMPLDFIATEASRRGMKLRTCAECENLRFIYYHDFKCIVCRTLDSEPFPDYS